jgi:hypothetical protein
LSVQEIGLFPPKSKTSSSWRLSTSYKQEPRGPVV